MIGSAQRLVNGLVEWMKRKVMNAVRNPLILIILFGSLVSAVSLLFANYIVFVELSEALAEWDLVTMSVSLALLFLEGIVLIYAGGWLSNNTRRR